MNTFREWMAEHPQQTASVQAAAKPQLWKATKEEIIPFWKNLRPDMPLAMNPIPYVHKGTTYSQDGIRITGSQAFIASVLPRLKEFMGYENAHTKLALVYRETQSKNSKSPAGNQTSFVFYIQAKERGPENAKKAVPQLDGQPRTPTPTTTG